MYSSLRAKAHHALDAGAVVPAAVHHHDLAARRQVLRIALEVPLAALDLAGFFQRDDARTARVQVFHETLDRAALAGRVAAFEEDQQALAAVLDPGLQLQQFHLQLVLLRLVGLARHQVAVRIAAVAPVARQHHVRVLAVRARPLVGLEQRVAKRGDVVRSSAGQDRLQRIDGFAGHRRRRAAHDVADGRALRVLLGQRLLAHDVLFDRARPQLRRCVAGLYRPHALGRCRAALLRRAGLGGLGGSGAACGCAAVLGHA